MDAKLLDFLYLKQFDIHLLLAIFRTPGESWQRNSAAFCDDVLYVILKKYPPLRRK